MSCTQGQRKDFVVGGLMFRPVESLEKGHVIDGHTHHSDHVCKFEKGLHHALLKFPDGHTEEKTFQEGDTFNVKKEVEHEITSLEDYGFFYCIFIRRNEAGEATENDGWVEGKSSGADFYWYI